MAKSKGQEAADKMIALIKKGARSVVKAGSLLGAPPKKKEKKK